MQSTGVKDPSDCTLHHDCAATAVMASGPPMRSIKLKAHKAEVSTPGHRRRSMGCAGASATSARRCWGGMR